MTNTDRTPATAPTYATRGDAEHAAYEAVTNGDATADEFDMTAIYADTIVPAGDGYELVGESAFWAAVAKHARPALYLSTDELATIHDVLRNAAAVQLDMARRDRLPGFGRGEGPAKQHTERAAAFHSLADKLNRAAGGVL